MGEAKLWSAPQPRCPVHGQMHFDFPVDRWTCPGWDGEGCDHTVRSEDQDWTYLGTTDGPVINL